RLIGPAVAGHVRGDGVEARGGQRLHLRPPADRQFGKAVDQQDQRALAGLEDSMVQAIGADVSLAHAGSGPSGPAAGKPQSATSVVRMISARSSGRPSPFSAEVSATAG